MRCREKVIRRQGEWLVRELAHKLDEREEQVRASLEELIRHGHMKVLPGEGPGGCDLFELVIKECGQ